MSRICFRFQCSMKVAAAGREENQGQGPRRPGDAGGHKVILLGCTIRCSRVTMCWIKNIARTELLCPPYRLSDTGTVTFPFYR